MFVGRTDELNALNSMFKRNRFEMAVIYGRRRIGKTALIDEFVKDKRVLYFTALQRSNIVNLRRFTTVVAGFFNYESLPPFEDWSAALSFVVRQSQDMEDRFVFVFDEFPYAAMMDDNLPSELQIAIDHGFKDSNIMMILSGSNEGFMESEVLGYKSPLYGRRTAQIQLQPLDYRTAAEFLPDAAPEELVNTYAAFGGTPYYLAQLDPQADFESNVLNLCFNQLGLLREEPSMLLREELREPALYYSVLQAIAGGSTTPKIIAEHSGVGEHGIGKYLKTLESLGLVERKVPFGESPEKSRRGLYSIKDPFFAYWYRFVSPALDAIDNKAGERVIRQLAFGDAFSTYVGQQFETLCMQWLVRVNVEGERMPFLATRFGKWWGNDPRKREQTDIDVVLANRQSKEILLGECKWRNTFNETEAVESLLAREGLISGYDTTYFMFFSKVEVSEATRSKYAGKVEFLSVQDLYR
ncbi:ATPase [Bifidobacterium lemurum]|uniref:ATPase n=1 Tax=Bifidobacterium lemurum TaxID=1603886 RepID=A0A261FQ78_9BIFI|nr:ATP-binding protein [Bifidobacterium lemurum]OZG61342.1 ATPase [Bifidobacterium lemurum]QOL34729.1 ATP-binding protein [Bifidobacterium lemurum]